MAPYLRAPSPPPDLSIAFLAVRIPFLSHLPFQNQHIVNLQCSVHFSPPLVCTTFFGGGFFVCGAGVGTGVDLKEESPSVSPGFGAMCRAFFGGGLYSSVSEYALEFFISETLF